MIQFSDEKDTCYLTRRYNIQAIYEVYNGVQSERHDQCAQLIVNIFLQAGTPDFVHCTTNQTIAKCELPKACVLYMDDLYLPAMKMRWTGSNFEVSVVTIGDEYVLGFGFENSRTQDVLLPPDSVHELHLLKTTHNKLERLGIVDVLQIPRSIIELRKLGFTEAQIRDLSRELNF